MRRGQGRKRAGAAERIGTERRRIRTVIVDDSAFIVESLGSFFQQQEGFEVVGIAETGLEAVDRVAELRPDLVMMDVRMPGMDGLEATRTIKACEDAPVVIMFTLEDSEGARAAAKAAGADDFVAKAPQGWEALAAAIRRAFPRVKVGESK
jgi:DNA-binding NarL/FixJ family response regulator